MKKCICPLVFLIMLISPGKGFSQPAISSFSPVNGPVGSLVTISGANFDADATRNIVYFGAVRATVISASVNQLTVKVPAGANYRPMSVTVNGLTAYSRNPFVVTFPGGGTGFTQYSFDTGAYTEPGLEYPREIGVADFNDDGKPDMMYATFQSQVRLFKNSSTPGNMAFAPQLNIPTYVITESLPAIADFNGDGRYDLAINTKPDNEDSITIFKNNSNGTNISFGSSTSYHINGFYNERFIAADMNNDGRPDIITLNNNIGPVRGVSILKNTSTSGNISFAAQQDFLFENTSFVFQLAASDIDGDGKQDLVVALTGDSVLIFRNTGTGGNISFAPALRYYCPLQPDLAIGDLDNDGRPDMVLLAAPLGQDKFSIYRNTSTPGNISFSGPADYNTGTMCVYIALSDLDGDGRVDIVIQNELDQDIAVFKNTSISPVISLLPSVNYHRAWQASGLELSDMDIDGKPDILVSNGELEQSANILRNITGEAARVNFCPPAANGSLSTDLTGSTYQWQLNTGSGYSNISDNSNYAGSTSATLTLSNIPSAWYGYQYRCQVNGTAYSTPLSLRFVNKWTGDVSSAWENPLNWSCGVVPDANTDVEINTGTVVLNSNTVCRTIQVRPGASFTVNTPFILTITH